MRNARVDVHKLWINSELPTTEILKFNANGGVSASAAIGLWGNGQRKKKCLCSHKKSATFDGRVLYALRIDYLGL